jgi:DNA-binding response OmpR family regulator
MNTKRTVPTAILAIDDEPDLLEAMKLNLEADGFVVHAFTSANEGIRFYEQHKREIALVLLDYLMPELMGDVVFECLQREDPAVKVLLLTASDDTVARTIFAKGLRGYMQKPFRMADLCERIREELALVPPPRQR